eukprot:m.184103 g.184103  ORF g.184103 m.184103 type:complete len:171 (+) comp13595_c1_seq13:416-928(+)
MGDQNIFAKSFLCFFSEIFFAAMTFFRRRTAALFFASLLMCIKGVAEHIQSIQNANECTFTHGHSLSYECVEVIDASVEIVAEKRRMCSSVKSLLVIAIALKNLFVLERNHTINECVEHNEHGTITLKRMNDSSDKGTVLQQLMAFLSAFRLQAPGRCCPILRCAAAKLE